MSETLTVGELRLPKRLGVRYTLSKVDNRGVPLVMLHVYDAVGKRSAMFTIDALHFSKGVPRAEVTSAEKSLRTSRVERIRLLGFSCQQMIDTKVGVDGKTRGNVAVVFATRTWLYFLAAHFEGGHDAATKTAWERFLKSVRRVR